VTRRALYVSHPEVVIDPAVPVTDWPLSELGCARAKAFAGVLRDLSGTQVFSSTERKALDLADILARGTGLPIVAREEMSENDRSATGYLERAEFEAVADQFFADPELSVRGWERAVDAQARIVGAVRSALAKYPAQDVIFCGHGAVGSLLYCHLTGVPIDRKWDQPGPGCWFAFDPESWRVAGHWKPLEDFNRP